MSNPDLDRLAAARHVLLTTFRADATAVSTTMWIAREGDALVMLTHAGAGKVARIRRGGRVELAPSDGRGRPQGGASSATALVVTDPDAVRRARELMRRRYGPQYPLLRGLMALRGRHAGQPVALRLTDLQPIDTAARIR